MDSCQYPLINFLSSVHSQPVLMYWTMKKEHNSMKVCIKAIHSVIQPNKKYRMYDFKIDGSWSTQY